MLYPVLLTGVCCTGLRRIQVYNNATKGLVVAGLVVGYTRVSTDQQGESGAGLDAQRAAIETEATRRGWSLDRIYTDVASGKSTRGRRHYGAALSRMTPGSVLVVAKLDRLSRSLLDFAELMAQAQRDGWSIVALDIGVDTSTVNGELVASIIMALAQWERRIIGQRTKDALGVVRARGTRLGRPTTVTDAALAVITERRSAGASLRETARALNRASVPTAQGGREWHASTVKAVEVRHLTP